MRATLSRFCSGSSAASSWSARRAMFFAATAFVAFAPILAACGCSTAAFFSALARSRRWRCLSLASG
jgi:hypothetical protein